MTTTSLTLAGAAIALAILYANLRPWWKGGRDPKQLLPFGQGLLLGALSTLCVGGILGWLVGLIVSAANGAGDRVVSGATGTSSGTLNPGVMGQLTPEGAVVVFLLAVGVVLGWKAASKLDKRRIAGGAFVGATLCLTAGVAGLLGILPTAVNAIGQWGVGALNGGSL
ncbi:hypothetical protein [Streptomyces chumphonensis]|uniref:hypothetical protein n=1 Tax=Streptomyces chumphonensis TaxID=1214925 RepID=UPI003D73F713